jgi:hypothetical protein
MGVLTSLHDNEVETCCAHRAALPDGLVTHAAFSLSNLFESVHSIMLGFRAQLHAQHRCQHEVMSGAAVATAGNSHCTVLALPKQRVTKHSCQTGVLTVCTPCMHCLFCLQALHCCQAHHPKYAVNKRHGRHCRAVLTPSSHLAGQRPNNNTQHSPGWCVASAITPSSHLAGVWFEYIARQSPTWCAATSTTRSSQPAGASCDSNTQEPPGVPLQ